MDFVAARPDIIRAVNQRWLLNLWTRGRGTVPLPNWQAVGAENLASLSTNLSFLDVVPSAGGARFLIRFHGDLICRVYGSADCRGRFLDQVVPPQSLPHALAPYSRTVDERLPVYTILDMIDRHGRAVHYERLLLPFSLDGQTADRILASFEFICPDGAFDGDRLMSDPVAPPSVRLSATIQAVTDA